MEKLAHYVFRIFRDKDGTFHATSYSHRLKDFLKKQKRIECHSSSHFARFLIAGNNI
jgi:hypothetical protein